MLWNIQRRCIIGTVRTFGRPDQHPQPPQPPQSLPQPLPQLLPQPPPHPQLQMRRRIMMIHQQEPPPNPQPQFINKTLLINDVGKLRDVFSCRPLFHIALYGGEKKVLQRFRIISLCGICRLCLSHRVPVQTVLSYSVSMISSEKKCASR